ncbi:MAG: archease [Desulfobacterales bacterium]|jgi:SHS2 domain-containing protein|nr:archease [Deltaproteobacteria bacterium]
MGFEEVEHTADHAMRIFGENLKELFVSAAEGMSSLMVADMSGIAGEIDKTIELEAIDPESLLVEWLSELAYWAEAEMLIFKTFRIKHLTDNHLVASVTGGKMPALEKLIKAVTYHNLKIKKNQQGLEVTIVFDV